MTRSENTALFHQTLLLSLTNRPFAFVCAHDRRQPTSTWHDSQGGLIQRAACRHHIIPHAAGRRTRWHSACVSIPDHTPPASSPLNGGSIVFDLHPIAS